jgi:hypothetical protein
MKVKEAHGGVAGRAEETGGGLGAEQRDQRNHKGREKER